MLHVLDGDAARPRFAASGIEGEVVVFREALLEGPWPRALRGVDDALAATQRATKEGREIILWFDEDLFCRLHAAWFAHQFPGAGLTNAAGAHAARDADALRALHARRTPLDPAIGEAWRAYAAPDPRGLVPLLARHAWLRLHAERFPHARDGLNAAERSILGIVAGGAQPLFEILRGLWASGFGPATYGLTDVEATRLLEELRPLVHETDGAWRIAEAGRDVLAGRADRLGLAPVDRWLGGVHLAPGRPAWRWDGAGFRAAP